MDNLNPTLAYEHHVLVCTNLRPDGRRSCAASGAHELLAAAKRHIAKRSGSGTLRANGSGCLGRCEHGPIMVIYPANVWLSCQTAQQVEDVLSQHLPEIQREP